MCGVSEDPTAPTPPNPGQPAPSEAPDRTALAKRGADAWPWYYSLAAFFGGFVAAQVVIVFLVVLWLLFGGDPEVDTWFTVFASAVNAVVLVSAAVFIARMSGPVTTRDFGLLRAPFWRTVGKSLAIMASYFVILAIYSELVNLTPDDAPEQLGADTGWLGMLGFALLVAIVAPIAEEVFFRGMVFRSLMNGIGLWPAAVVSGVLFGAVHIDSFDEDRLLQVVPLAVLGVAFAVLYIWAGTLYAPIALHATNNALAVLVFAEDNDSTFGMVLAGVLWLAMMAFCVLAPRLSDREDDAAPPPPADPPFPMAPGPPAPQPVQNR